MITLIITGLMIVLLNGLLVVLLANQNNKIKRELEIYKNRLDDIPINRELKKYGIKINKNTKQVESILTERSK